MTHTRTARQAGICHWRIPTGPGNRITDVPGVTVGHATLSRGEVQTGVTALFPHPGNVFRHKPVAAAHVVNGFGKSMGLIQVNELGTLETPLILTNTLGIGTASHTLIQTVLADNPEIGLSTGTVNPMVFECNDGRLNDIRGLHVTPGDVQRALSRASENFDQGAVGAGTGMSAFELKGGIGSASRKLTIGQRAYTLGILVLTNMGKLPDLIISGDRVGPRIQGALSPVPDPENDGSVIVIIATDIPLGHRQLGRITRRAVTGLSLTGSPIESGSGEIVLAFSTAALIPHFSDQPLVSIPQVREDELNPVFRALCEGVEEAVLNSMFCAATTRGRDGNRALGLGECLEKISWRPPSP